MTATLTDLVVSFGLPSRLIGETGSNYAAAKTALDNLPMTATLTDREMFERAIAANPGDVSPMLEYADWLDEREAEVGCKECSEGNVEICECWMFDCGEFGQKCKRPSLRDCPACHGTGRISNGYARLAAAYRWCAAEGKRPLHTLKAGNTQSNWVWSQQSETRNRYNRLPQAIFPLLRHGKPGIPVGQGRNRKIRVIYYPTFAAAMEALAAALASAPAGHD